VERRTAEQTTEGLDRRALESRIHELERRLYEAEAKYEALVEQLPAAIYVHSPDPDGPTYYGPTT
jgi:PAS domain-containing protein